MLFKVALPLTLNCSYTFAQVDSLKTKSSFESIESDWEQYSKKLDSNWVDYVSAQEKDWELFTKNIIRKWNTFEKSDHKIWIEYSDNLDSKTKIDFEAGVVEIEAITEENQPDVEEKLQNIIERETINLLNTMVPVIDEPLLANQIQLEVKSGNKHFNEADELEFVNSNIKPEIKVSNEILKSNDGINRVKAKVKFYLNKNHLDVRANKYLPFVKQYCELYNIEAALVIAMMERESAFNPIAESQDSKGNPIATGLMQLVPWSGGKDAYNALGYEGKPTREFLKNPENSINLGVKYISILENIFKKVEDKEKRNFLIISAYNTGVSNVNKSFSNTTVRDTIKKANLLERNDLYEHLINSLPFEETQTYLKIVANKYNKLKSEE